LQKGKGRDATSLGAFPPNEQQQKGVATLRVHRPLLVVFQGSQFVVLLVLWLIFSTNSAPAYVHIYCWLFWLWLCLWWYWYYVF
jgi:hypothetical protein